MERINVKKGMVEVTINPVFYSKECILKTKKVFNDFSKVFIKDSGEYIIVTIKPKTKTDLEEIGYEFYNYLLNTVKEMGLGL